ncbi:MAG: transposase [Actinobacteria bacterium]|nr:transposase [Actinomycetota bacterium]
MPRRPRNVLPKRGIYHVTCRGVERRPIFGDDVDRAVFMELIHGARRRFRWRLHVATLMDNHVHLIVETRRGRLSRGMHRLAGIYAQRFNRRYDRVGHLFQGRFSAFVIEGEEHFLNACAYVLQNPVRAGLCRQAEDWPWSWSRFSATATGTTEPRRGRPPPAPAPAEPVGRS